MPSLFAKHTCWATIEDGDPIMEPCTYRTKSGKCKGDGKCYFNSRQHNHRAERGDCVDDDYYKCSSCGQTVHKGEHDRHEWGHELAEQARDPVPEPMAKQLKYCKDNKLPFFAPRSGICWSCHQQIPDRGDELITGCNHCCRSYCD